MGGLLPAPGSLSSALRSRYRSNWPQWRRAPASHPARPARTRRNSPPGPPVKRRAIPLALPRPATAPRPKPIGGHTCLSSRARAYWSLSPWLPGSLFSPARPESPPPLLIGRSTAAPAPNGHDRGSARDHVAAAAVPSRPRPRFRCWNGPGQGEPASSPAPTAPPEPTPLRDCQKGPGSVQYQGEMIGLQPCQSFLIHVHTCSYSTELTRGESAFPKVSHPSRSSSP